MGLKVRGIGAVKRALVRTEQRTTKALLRHMRNSAILIRDLAREYAPVDQGDLENAIVATEAPEVSFGRKRQVAFVGVDSSVLGPGYNRWGFRYDIHMHEGAYKLGPLSQAKQDASGKTVGPKYLTRACEDLKPEIYAKAESIVAKEVR